MADLIHNFLTGYYAHLNDDETEVHTSLVPAWGGWKQDLPLFDFMDKDNEDSKEEELELAISPKGHSHLLMKVPHQKGESSQEAH